MVATGKAVCIRFSSTDLIYDLVQYLNYRLKPHSLCMFLAIHVSPLECCTLFPLPIKPIQTLSNPLGHTNNSPKCSQSHN